MACADGYKFSIVENAVFRPGGDDVMVVVNGVRIEDGVMKAHLSSVGSVDGVGASLVVGEAVVHPGVGTYTLLDVVPRSRPAGQDGGGGQASFCFEPEPGFALDREYFGLPDDSQSAD
ncbi:hypothetical protein [Schaalia vaccimaxillae]|uniref:hypothetical protein n=1 Tax=Schaalia vaccimaxillae TaxID=183916 RepID=UPI00103DFAE0|nr:hypothetical protein [Schaalia vaccimaxillae]